MNSVPIHMTDEISHIRFSPTAIDRYAVVTPAHPGVRATLHTRYIHKRNDWACLSKYVEETYGYTTVGEQHRLPSLV